MKLKSLLAEALTPLDKKAVQSFFDGKPFEGKNLNSDGKTLKTVGIGSQPMYTHTPNGVKMLGKVTGGYSQSLVQYVNKVHKGDLGEARIPNNSTSARMAGVVSTSNINNLFKVVEPLIEELSADGFDLEDIVGFIAKRIEAKFAGVYEGKTLNENINKDVKSFLDKSLKGLKAGSPPHLFAVKHTLIGALTDANFHSEAKKVPALFPKAEFEPTAYGESEGEAIHMYEYEVGPQIARIAEYDGGAIVDAIGFYVSMTIGRPLGEKIEKLVESKLTISKFIKENIRITKNGDVLLKTKG